MDEQIVPFSFQLAIYSRHAKKNGARAAYRRCRLPNSCLIPVEAVVAFWQNHLPAVIFYGRAVPAYAEKALPERTNRKKEKGGGRRMLL